MLYLYLVICVGILAVISSPWHSSLYRIYHCYHATFFLLSLYLCKIFKRGLKAMHIAFVAICKLASFITLRDILLICHVPFTQLSGTCQDNLFDLVLIVCELSKQRTILPMNWLVCSFVCLVEKSFMLCRREFVLKLSSNCINLMLILITRFCVVPISF